MNASPPHTIHIQRCPACGQRVEQDTRAKCGLCDFSFEDEGVGGVDMTPYAKAYAAGDSGWKQMAEWVWYANAERIKHLSLIRTSAASSRFAWTGLLVLCGAVAMFQASRVGWQARIDAANPLGDGWLRVVSHTNQDDISEVQGHHTTLWWNPAQGMIGWAAGAIAAVLLGTVGLRGLQMAYSRAHGKSYYAEQRMGAALHYSLAWAPPLILGITLMALSPIALVGEAAHWGWYPSQRGFALAMGVLGAFSIAMWWYFLVRLSLAAPYGPRRNVLIFSMVGLPTMVASAAAFWWFGLDFVLTRVFTLLNLSF